MTLDDVDALVSIARRNLHTLQRQTKRKLEALEAYRAPDDADADGEIIGLQYELEDIEARLSLLEAYKVETM